MNKYTINYGYGVADFYCEATEEKRIITEFYNCANCCFGIRKSITREPSIEKQDHNVELPLPYRDKGATHFLSHGGGDQILFNFSHKFQNSPWKLMNECGDWCSCKKLGRPDPSCAVHGELDN